MTAQMIAPTTTFHYKLLVFTGQQFAALEDRINEAAGAGYRLVTISRSDNGGGYAVMEKTLHRE